MSARARAATPAKPRWRTIVTWIVYAVVLWFVLKTYVGFSIASKTFECIQSMESPGTNLTGEQQKAVLTETIECVDGKVNFVERLWFDKEEAIRSIGPKGEG